MGAALTLALILAATPPAGRAGELARHGDWEGLYLTYSAAKPRSFPASQRADIAAALERGARSLEKRDAVMAYSLAERAVAFDATPGRILLLARTARATAQNGAAEKALRTGLERHPRNAGLALALGQLLLEEEDAPGAQGVLARIPRTAPEHAEAQRLLRRARAQQTQRTTAHAQTAALERQLRRRAAQSPSPAKSGTLARTPPRNAGYQSLEGPSGMRVRQGQRFVFRYFQNARDFGQRAEYEGEATAALEEAAAFAERTLGLSRSAPLDVVLYSPKEFAAHFGDVAASRVMGLYSLGAIQMNHAEDITPRTRATLVHEYVHALLDEQMGGNGSRLPRWLNEGLAEYVEWRYQGSEAPPVATAQRLRSLARADNLPSLARLSADLEGASANDPGVAYGASAVAARLLLAKGGPDVLWAVLREVGAGGDFDEVYRRRYAEEPHALEEALREELSGR